MTLRNGDNHYNIKPAFNVEIFKFIEQFFYMSRFLSVKKCRGDISMLQTNGVELYMPS